MDLVAWAETFAAVEDKLAIRRTAVLAITIWMTWRSYAWAIEFAREVLSRGSLTNEAALGAAALIAAVTAPIGLLQSAVFKSYIESKT